MPPKLLMPVFLVDGTYPLLTKFNCYVTGSAKGATDPPSPQFLADQLTLFHPVVGMRADYAHQIFSPSGTPVSLYYFSDDRRILQECEQNFDAITLSLPTYNSGRKM